MTMKPEHTRPFSFDHAKAGAPYGTITGAAVEILKWDMHRNSGPILAIIGEHQETVGYTREGKSANAVTLVMLPLGMIEGRPVFVDDDYIEARKKPRIAKPEERDFTCCTWPKPAKEYPKTRMSRDQLFDAITLEEGEYCADDAKFTRRSVEIANAAISRAIDDGDVFTREQVIGMLVSARHDLIAIMTHTASAVQNPARGIPVSSVLAEAIQSACEIDATKYLDPK